ncbi:LCP family protein [Nocardioides sp. WL0053]|jgi:polyisoprenyl-teichoic acid--peptidoglycan teichoic acid transferase|uniref:LCP family protein n=1 Tax=Nocardioides jiangsuensis TaxID=2866161 RepID=A0ABS7RKP7_9ACTN|nr:LCP family protein [Nocardioides jiangsuensis]MBY9075616.1 LCP family protein [Nocardioides jiangsuensis]
MNRPAELVRRLAHPSRGASRRLRTTLLLGVVLAMTAVVVPPASVRESPTSLMKVETADGVDHTPAVEWVLLLGSDARPGQSVTRSRADAIQLVGINTRTGAATAIGIPRDSWVDVPGHGNNKINAAMYFGGPQLMAQAVGNMVGIQPDYVFTTSFVGFAAMVNAIGGITVSSKYAFSDPVRPKGYEVGRNKLNGIQAMVFARLRKPFPGGDFDRSANQQRTLRGILAQVRYHQAEPGFMERGVMSVLNHLDTPNVRPAELYNLAQAATRIDPRKLEGCVIGGRVGYVGAASVVFADIGQARSIAARTRADATLDGGC